MSLRCKIWTWYIEDEMGKIVKVTESNQGDFLEIVHFLVQLKTTNLTVRHTAH